MPEQSRNNHQNTGGESLLQAALDTLELSVVVLNAGGQIVATNSAWQRQAQRQGVPATASYVETLRAGCHARAAAQMESDVQSVLSGERPASQATYTCALPTETRHIHLSIVPLGDSRGGVTISQTDITAQTRREAELLERANQDPLTGLPNRRSFFAEADKTLALAKRHDYAFSLLYLDLDGFKAVNDANGHEVGDEVLRQVAARLSASLRAGDLAARLGVDEFSILLQGVGEAASLEAAKRYRRRLAQPFEIAGEPVALRGSLGAASYPRHGETVEALLRHADTAMYRAKRNSFEKLHDTPKGT